MGYRNMSWFVHTFHKTFHMVLEVYAKTSTYIDCLEYVRLRFFFMLKLYSKGLKQWFLLYLFC